MKQCGPQKDTSKQEPNSMTVQYFLIPLHTERPYQILNRLLVQSNKRGADHPQQSITISRIQAQLGKFKT
jgi:hypothetical protein